MNTTEYRVNRGMYMDKLGTLYVLLRELIVHEAVATSASSS